MIKQHEKLNYVEFPAYNLTVTKAFFAQAFEWKFKDFGSDYTAFSGQGIDGGFFNSPLHSSTKNGAALLVFYSETLEHTLAKIERFGGTIVKSIFEFPGGRRFHFCEPSGNEFAVWSDKS